MNDTATTEAPKRRRGRPRHPNAAIDRSIEAREALAEMEAQEQAEDDASRMSLTKDDLIDIIRESRKESPEREAEKERQKQAREQSKANLVQQIEVARQQKEANQAACTHRKYNSYGQDVGTAIQGQRHSDGMFHGLCVRCFREFEPEPALAHPNAGGRIQGGAVGW